ncbi:CBS domain-containing protein [Gemmobacter caeruleus]|uniref:CBS domain-containing protein n=1 Tax=Gemmobacter caeruleus TaxID=2595004 RepID=UPI0011EFFAC3|nr:CBS domain-containing protein [Gemmobacter caeruleus]
MHVAQILKTKPSGEVITVTPGTSVAELAHVLSVRKIGAVVVSPDGASVAGIVSERDVVRELGKRGPACLAETVDTLMTTRIVSCTPQETTHDVLQKMTDGRFRHMPVMEGERMVGFISIGDVVKSRLMELAAEKDALEGMIKGF